MSEKKRNPFKLKDFRGIETSTLEKLAACRIVTAGQMLEAGATRRQRAKLAQASGVPEEVLLELVRLADLARLPGVKGIRARLYLDAGIIGVQKMAGWEAEPLRIMVTEYVQRTGFEGIPPLPKEVSSTIENARRLPVLVEE